MIAKLSLVIQCAPYTNSASLAAFRLAQSIAANPKASLNDIFFYGDGVYHALLNQAEDNETIDLDWLSLSVPLSACVASVKRRGITPSSEIKIVGLGFLAELYQQNDKVIVLG